jgi:hypothetical protein
MVVIAALVTSCGGYYYRATVQGFVVDEESDIGINEATIRIYTSEVESATADGFVSSTSTVTQGASPGYYSSTVIWNNWFGEYGGEGDTTEIWLGISHPDYADRVVRAEGILSNENNLIATVRLTETTFRLEALQGRVVDSNGEGVNGVRVVLDLPELSGTDDREDRIVQSATINGQRGTFEFRNIEWDESNTAAGSGEVTAIVRVDDAEWGDPGYTGGPEPTDDYIIEKAVTLIPADQTRTLSSSITVYRLPRTEFSAVVAGRVLERLTDETRVGVQGVQVVLTYIRQEDSGPVTETLLATSNAAGGFQFSVTWTDNAPEDFDNADARTGAAQGPDTAGIDPGEDGLLIDVSYSDVGSLPFSAGDLMNVAVLSNPTGGINYLPDNIQ